MTLINDDCLDAMRNISSNSVDMLFADLPYGQTSCKWDSEISLVPFWAEVNRICKPDAPMIFTCSVRFGNTLINSNPRNFRYDLVWVKSTTCGFLNAKKMPMKKHEMIYVFYRKLPSVYQDSIKEHHTHKFGKSSTIKTEHDTAYGENIHYHNTQQRNGESIYDPPLPNSIVECKSEKGKHATQKPVALMEWILKYYSRENDTVLDPTMGSGSMGVACKNMNRSFIGIEKDKEIFDVATGRIMKTNPSSS